MTIAEIPASSSLRALSILLEGGFSGMASKNIPLVQWQYGWFVVGAAIIVVDVMVYVMFKRRHWL